MLVTREKCISEFCLESQKERETEGSGCLGVEIRQRYTVRGLGRSLGFHEVAGPRFPDNRDMKGVKLSALCPGRHYAQ
jgi:hypothetical protein